MLAKEGNRSDTKTLTLAVVEPLVASTTTALARAEVSRPFSQAQTAQGGLAPYTWSLASGTLPSGLTLDPATGTIRGIPLAAGAFPLTLAVKDTAGLTATVNVPLAVAKKLAITSIRLRAGVEGRRYSTLITKVGGVGPIRYRIVGGRLPVGVRLDTSTGRVSGIPRRERRFPDHRAGDRRSRRDFDEAAAADDPALVGRRVSGLRGRIRDHARRPS